MRDKWHKDKLACKRKQAFSNLTKAYVALQNNYTLSEEDRQRITPYRCIVCGNWHLGKRKLSTREKGKK